MNPERGPGFQEQAREASEKAAVKRQEVVEKHLAKEGKPAEPSEAEKTQEAVETGKAAQKFLEKLQQGEGGENK